MMPTKLYIEDDAGNVQVLPMETDEVSVGRAPDNSIVLPERNVSRHHARLRHRSGRYYVADAGSRFGLRVNGVRMIDDELEVKPGDLVFVGDFKMKVLPQDAAIREDEAGTKQVRAVVLEPALPQITATGVLDLREMDRVAEIGWRSDFFDGEDQASRRLTPGRIVLLAVLVVVAVGLGVVYFLLSSESEPAAPRRATQVATTEAVAPPSAAPTQPEAKVAEAVPAIVPVPAPSPAAAPAPEAKIVKAKPAEPKPAEPKPARVDEKKPAEPKVAQAEKHPEAAKQILQAGGGDAIQRIDTALDMGVLSEAESLLSKCVTPDCTSRWKRLAAKFQAQGNAPKAIEIFKRLRYRTNDPRQREFYEKQIQALGGTVD